MQELLQRYKDKAPEIVFEWHDSETDAVGWIVINSLRGGAAGGGTRMRLGVTKGEVLSLAKVMEIKFSVCGPAIGGAKSGINFDPTDPRKDEVLSRWYKAVMPLLKTYYGTGGDMNVDEIHDVIPITESYGLWHPQEGIVVGHFKTTQGRLTPPRCVPLFPPRARDNRRLVAPPTCTSWTRGSLIWRTPIHVSRRPATCHHPTVAALPSDQPACRAFVMNPSRLFKPSFLSSISQTGSS